MLNTWWYDLVTSHVNPLLTLAYIKPACILNQVLATAIITPIIAKAGFLVLYIK